MVGTQQMFLSESIKCLWSCWILWRLTLLILLLKYQQYIVLLPSESILNSAGIFIISVFKGSCARELAS